MAGATELTRISNQHDPLAHWPHAIPSDVQNWLDQLTARSVDTPETTTLTTIDSEGDTLNSKATLQGGALVLESAFDTTFTDTSGSASVDVSFQATLRK